MDKLCHDDCVFQCNRAAYWHTGDTRLLHPLSWHHCSGAEKSNAWMELTTLPSSWSQYSVLEDLFSVTKHNLEILVCIQMLLRLYNKILHTDYLLDLTMCAYTEKVTNRRISKTVTMQCKRRSCIKVRWDSKRMEYLEWFYCITTEKILWQYCRVDAAHIYNTI